MVMQSMTNNRPWLAQAFAALLLIAVPLSGAGAGEIEDLKTEIEGLKKNQERMLSDLDEIKQILIRATGGGDAPSARSRELTVAGSPFMGQADAPVTLVEFSDYQCPYCRRHYQTVMPQLRDGQVADGTLKYVMKEFPIDSIHPMARGASVAALCAGDEDAYWPMHDRIMDDPQRMRPRDLTRHAEALDLDEDKFAACMEAGDKSALVDADIAMGQQFGIQGTPSFLIGVTDPDNPDKMIVLNLLRGARPLADFERAIKQALAAAKRS